MTDSRPLILLTNDDGITSPGLAAAVAAVDSLGEVLIVAPRSQQTSAGRSMPQYHDGRLFETTISRNGSTWVGYSADASPAQAVQHGVLEVASRPVSLIVSGINFGENVGIGVTISGTVGAALEGAALGIPSLAVSLQVDPSLHHNFDDSVDFGGALHFTRVFAAFLLNSAPMLDVDMLKVEIPASATSETPWEVTRLERAPYYIPKPAVRENLEDQGRMGYEMAPKVGLGRPDTDVAALLRGVVSVTPLSLDMTSRIPLDELGRLLRKGSP